VTILPVAFGEELRSPRIVGAAQQIPELQRDWAISPADSISKSTSRRMASSRFLQVMYAVLAALELLPVRLDHRHRSLLR